MKTVSIKDMERFCGIKAHTIRTWEHRYGILQPQRKNSTTRYYSLEELEKALQLCLLNRNGYKISQLAKLSDGEISQKVGWLFDPVVLQERAINNLISCMYRLNVEGFDTLAQTVSTFPPNMEAKPIRLLYGKGVSLTDTKAIQRHARCKLITQTTILSLIDVAKEKGAKDRVQAYWNTYHCQNHLYTAEGKVYAPHCKNRFCTYCCGIRKAELIKKYLPIIGQWPAPHFLTLTAKAVVALQLKARMKNMARAFREINDSNRQKARRGTAPKLIGLRSLECNFNPVTHTYNPHFHFLVPDKGTADLLRAEWLKLWTPKFAGSRSQNCRKVTNCEKDLIEVLKYGAKIVTDPDAKKDRGKKGKAKIYVRALYNIHGAMKGCRLIERFGFNALRKDKKKADYQLTEDYQLWQYHLKSRDWVSDESDGTLTNFSPDFELENLLEVNIDNDLE